MAECSDDKSLDKITRKKLQIQHAASISIQAKMVKLADKLSNLMGLFQTPPASWTKEEINGNAVWSWFVVQALSKFEINLDNAAEYCNFHASFKLLSSNLTNLFAEFGFDKLNTTELNAILEKYYTIIDKSE